MHTGFFRPLIVLRLWTKQDFERSYFVTAAQIKPGKWLSVSVTLVKSKTSRLLHQQEVMHIFHERLTCFKYHASKIIG
ncbi:hypothetical protein JHK82_017706 [Glycine max]|nr:hypothetical protein JHK82_017706 [Glycine max]